MPIKVLDVEFNLNYFRGIDLKFIGYHVWTKNNQLQLKNKDHNSFPVPKHCAEKYLFVKPDLNRSIPAWPISNDKSCWCES